MTHLGHANAGLLLFLEVLAEQRNEREGNAMNDSGASKEGDAMTEETEIINWLNRSE